MISDGHGIGAVVPVKRLVLSKSRLAGVLTPFERAALTEAMFCDVLDVLVNSKRLNTIIVVSHDRRVAEWCGRFGVEVVVDEADAGMNPAVLAGMQRLAAEHCRGALVVPADVPYVTRAEIDNAVVALGKAQIVLAKADRDGGTNLLGMAPIDLIPPCFGADSLAKHLHAARGMGIEPMMLPAIGVGRDIDMPVDLEWFSGGGPAQRTRMFLSRVSDLRI